MIKSCNCGRPSKIQHRRRSRSQQGATLSNRTLRPKNKKFRGQSGRRVTFTNSFAIEGHYFNFSTAGQWLWDELTLALASSQNPYPIVEAIQKAVLEATAESAGQAEKEWQNAAHSRSMRALSAAPAINVKPVSGGVEIAVRYITRANERYQLRSKLYQVAMNLISKKDSLAHVSISEKQEPKPI